MPANFLHFKAVFGRIWPNNRLVPLFGVGDPRVGNPEYCPFGIWYKIKNCRGGWFWTGITVFRRRSFERFNLRTGNLHHGKSPKTSNKRSQVSSKGSQQVHIELQLSEESQCVQCGNSKWFNYTGRGLTSGSQVMISLKNVILEKLFQNYIMI